MRLPHWWRGDDGVNIVVLKKKLARGKTKLAINSLIVAVMLTLLVGAVYVLGFIYQQQSEERASRQQELAEAESRIKLVKADIKRMEYEKERAQTPRVWKMVRASA